MEMWTTVLGRVVQLEGKKAAIQVFEGTNGISLKTKNKIYRKADGACVITRDAGAYL